MTGRITALFVTTVLAATSCSASGGTVQLDEDDAGRTIDVTLGDRIDIELEGNPTTGYTWELLQAVGVTQIGDATHEPESDLAGAPGTTRFSFEPAGEGEGSVRLIYHRPWEEEPPLQTYEIQFVVTP